MSKQPADLQPADPQPADPESADPESAPGRETALPPFRYDARLADQIELRWQGYWESAGTFAAPNPVGPLSAGYRAGQPKCYVLDMFPYASGTPPGANTLPPAATSTAWPAAVSHSIVGPSRG